MFSGRMITTGSGTGGGARGFDRGITGEAEDDSGAPESFLRMVPKKLNLDFAFGLSPEVVEDCEANRLVSDGFGGSVADGRMEESSGDAVSRGGGGI